jgi:hypothetical protein
VSRIFNQKYQGEILLARWGDLYGSVIPQVQNNENNFFLLNNEIALSDISDDIDKNFQKKIAQRLSKVENKKSFSFIQVFRTVNGKRLSSPPNPTPPSI